MDEAFSDTLDEISRSYLRIADRLWDEARARRVKHEISRSEFNDTRAVARALIRRSVEIVTSASVLRLRDIQGSVEALEGISTDLKRVTNQIERAEDIVKVGLAAVSSVTLIVASVAAPSPATLGGALSGVAELMATIIAGSGSRKDSD